MYSCQRVLVNQHEDLVALLMLLCEKAHNLTNMGIYYARQLYFKANKSIGKFNLEKLYKHNNHYKVLYFQATQQILRTVTKSFKSYIKDNKPQGFWSNKLAGITEKYNRQIHDGINKVARSDVGLSDREASSLKSPVIYAYAGEH